MPVRSGVKSLPTNGFRDREAGPLRPGPASGIITAVLPLSIRTPLLVILHPHTPDRARRSPAWILPFLAAGLLADAGVPAVVVGDDAGGMYPSLVGVRSRVAREDEARAREALVDL